MSRRFVKARRAAASRGMTLLEIMVVIVIIGLISSITAVAVMNQLVEARIKTTKMGIESCEQALKLYALRHGRYPDTSQGLAILVAERFVPKAPADAWGHELLYVRDGEGYTLTSYGADGAAGGTGADEDIVVPGGR